MSVDRVIRMLAGFFVMVSLGLGWYVSPYWLLFTAFVGFSLFQSALTGFCPMEMVLQKLGIGQQSEG